MIRLIRIIGFMFIVAGAISVATWVIKPLRFLWPWLRQLPLAIQVGLAAAVLGLLLLVGSMIWERWEDHRKEKELIDEP